MSCTLDPTTSWFSLQSYCDCGLTIFALSLIGVYVSGHLFSRRTDIIIYCLAFACSLIWYFSIQAKQDREWDPEVAQQLYYEKQGDLVHLYNIRNFNWHTDGTYEIHWEDRKIDLNKITGVNVITSYWMGPQIAHTLVSFNFQIKNRWSFRLKSEKKKAKNSLLWEVFSENMNLA